MRVLSRAYILVYLAQLKVKSFGPNSIATFLDKGHTHIHLLKQILSCLICDWLSMLRLLQLSCVLTDKMRILRFLSSIQPIPLSGAAYAGPKHRLNIKYPTVHLAIALPRICHYMPIRIKNSIDFCSLARVLQLYDVAKGQNKPVSFPNITEQFLTYIITCSISHTNIISAYQIVSINHNTNN